METQRSGQNESFIPIRERNNEFVIFLTINILEENVLIFLLSTRRSNQSILKEISPGISLEGMMLKLKLQSLATSREELTHWKRL